MKTLKVRKIDILAEKISKEALYQKYIVEDLDRKDVAAYFNISKYDLINLLNLYNIRIPISQKMRKTRARQLANMTPERAASIKAKELATKAAKSEEEKAIIVSKSLATKKQRELENPGCYDENRRLGYEKRSRNLLLKPESFWEERLRKYRETVCKNNSQEKAIKKQLETKRNRKRLNTSFVQDIMHDYLRLMYPGTVAEYNIDSRYPFHCDFYIPQYDLFIELNAHWTHGKHPFDPNNPDDQKQLETLKSRCKSYTTKSGVEKKNSYYGAIKVWTELDPLKLSYARKNKLNYIAFYNVGNLEALNIIRHIDFDKLRGIYIWDASIDYKYRRTDFT